MEAQETSTAPVEETKVDPLDTDEVNKASYEFTNLMPRIRGMAKNMGGKALARVYGAVAAFPFIDGTPKFRSQTENELFVLTLHAMALKNVMSNALDTHRAEIEALATQGMVEEKLKEIKGEENVEQ